MSERRRDCSTAPGFSRTLAIRPDSQLWRGEPGEARVARGRGSRVADFAWAADFARFADFARGRGARGAGQRPATTLPAPAEIMISRGTLPLPEAVSALLVCVREAASALPLSQSDSPLPTRSGQRRRGPGRESRFVALRCIIGIIAMLLLPRRSRGTRPVRRLNGRPAGPESAPRSEPSPASPVQARGIEPWYCVHRRSRGALLLLPPSRQRLLLLPQHPMLSRCTAKPGREVVKSLRWTDTRAAAPADSHAPCMGCRQ
jgi:hypothetical protein